jgi:hypothetical protein
LKQIVVATLVAVVVNGVVFEEAPRRSKLLKFRQKKRHEVDPPEGFERRSEKGASRAHLGRPQSDLGEPLAESGRARWGNERPRWATKEARESKMTLEPRPSRPQAAPKQRPRAHSPPGPGGTHSRTVGTVKNTKEPRSHEDETTAEHASASKFELKF